MNVPTRTAEPSQRAQPAFTLLELMMVVSIIAILVCLLLPAISGAKARAKRTACLNNLRQLQLCWAMYTHEHDDLVPPNRAQQVSGIWRSTPDSWAGPSSAPRDPSPEPLEQGALFGYHRSVALYHCPSDLSRVRTSGGAGPGPLRTRSYSMSGCYGGRTNEVQTVIIKACEIRNPAQSFVLLDEQEEGIDDGHFLCWDAPDMRYVNMPADRHEQGCNLSFADGHVEHWTWRWAKTWTNKTSYFKVAENDLDLADLRRLQAALPAKVPPGTPPQP